jgi:hypothetical protein
MDSHPFASHCDYMVSLLFLSRVLVKLQVMLWRVSSLIIKRILLWTRMMPDRVQKLIVTTRAMATANRDKITSQLYLAQLRLNRTVVLH